MQHRHGWKNPRVVESFLDSRRRAIPFGEEQIDIMIRIITGATKSVKSFVDLGCGDGILSQVILAEYPEASGILIDYSESMLNAAKDRFSSYSSLDIKNLDLSTMIG